MGFKDILGDFKKNLALCYQSQKNIVDVSQKYIGMLEEAYESGGSGGGVDYSTDEQDTGLKWIDGSSIYQRTFKLSETITAQANSWTDTLITITGATALINVFINSGKSCYTISSSGLSDNNTLTINVPRALTMTPSSADWFFTVQYLKTT